MLPGEAAQLGQEVKRIRKLRPLVPICHGPSFHNVNPQSLPRSCLKKSMSTSSICIDLIDTVVFPDWV
ncbi:hypothetical protein PILCRDRAFT_815897 [Piloderma croceum F 1598]|uniref:Uncharacterized protein n=1 Tax=Piloderma croceum (strain F 1598) TaxID=765440 RepID=A0A0C3BJY1_PILCF|nr:hypothetical protein PILCRDRAFT_815897 [Piloderma croceum F 1598]